MKVLFVLLLSFLFADSSFLKIPIKKFELDNGLEVVISKVSRVPTVGVALLYKVGSRNEKPDEYGFAHLFEHMMFQGSSHIKKMEHFKLINSVGGKLNAFTWKDFTMYYELVPKNNLELALYLEADRMNSLKVNLENLNNQKQTVIEELKQRYENQPYGKAYIKLSELAYENPEYGHPVIGSIEKIKNATLEMVKKFHEKFYRPNNAILVIAGDVDVSKTLKLVKKYFEPIEEGDRIEPIEIVEPVQKEYKEKTIEDKIANLPALFMAWHIPPVTHPDYYAIDVLSRILFDGKSSRLYQKLVKQKELAISISGGVEGKKGPDLMVARVILNKPLFDEAIQLIEEEIEKISQEGIKKDELNKVLTTVKTEFVDQLKSNLTLAKQIAFYTFLFEDPESINKEIDKYKKVTIEDLKRVAKKYFKHSNLSVIKVEVKK